MKHIGDRYLVLANSESYYSHSNEVTLIKASLILDVHTFELRLNFVRHHISDKEPQSKTHLPSYNVGTFFKVKKKLIKNLLNDNQLRRSPFKGWDNEYTHNGTVTELFNDLKTKDYLIMRAIKLLKIKKVLKKRNKI